MKSTVLCLLILLTSCYSLYGQTEGCACPPLNTCFACNGGITYLKLGYNSGGIITDMSAADDGGALTTSFQNGIITINSRTAGQPFEGDLKVTVTKFLEKADSHVFKTTCAEKIFAGQKIQHFDVLEGASVAGPLCCEDGKQDKVTPSFGTSCPGDIAVSTAAGGCATTVTWTLPVATDNCGNVVLTSTHQPGDVFNVGTTTVTYTATDDYNNTKTCSFKVDVKDGTKPVIANCPANIVIPLTAGCNAVATWTAPTATDDCTLSSLTSTHSPGALFSVGITTVTYTAKDAANNISTCSFTVTITDDIAPVISNCPQNIAIDAISSLACTASVTWTAPTASDNCSIKSLTSDHAPGSTFPTGTTTVTYTAKDPAGNSATCSFTVTVRDKTNPIFTKCTADVVVNAKANCSTTVTWTAPIATDNCGTPILTSNHQPGEIFSAGITTVIYTATDASGNIAKCSFKVTVNDKTAPVIQCVTDITSSTDGTCGATVTWTDPVATDCSSVTFVSEPKSGSVFQVGTTTVTYTATDADGNSSQCTFKVTVSDKTAPVFSNCTTTVNAVADQSCSAVVNWTIPIATDNCSSVTLTSSHAPGSSFAAGTTRVTYTVKDIAGNTSSCAFDVVVVDGQATLSNCPNDIEVQADQTGQLAVTWAEPIIMSNCGNAELTANHSPGDIFQTGTTQVVYTLSGSDGSSVLCQFNVVVLPIDVSFVVNQLVTPNGDGVNDTWQLTHIERFKENKVILMDRWGGVVYEASGYNNENISWKGSNANGTQLPAGTYFYTITVQFNEQEVNRKGFIELIR